MKLIITSIDHGNLKHEEIELPEQFLDISLELNSGPIFQIDIDDNEEVLNIRETTYRKLALMPTSSNGVNLKGI